jgi:two-component system, NtrC family, sensor kinase
MKTVSISLFWKFSLAIVSIVVLFGYLTLSRVDREVQQLLESEMDKFGHYYGLVFAHQQSNTASPESYTTTSDSVNLDSMIMYAILYDSGGNVLKETRHRPFSSKNNTGPLTSERREEPACITLKNAGGIIIRDCLVPLKNGSSSFVRIGLNSKMLLDKKQVVNNKFIGIVLVFLAVGILGAFVFSSMITNPLKIIARQASELDLGSPEEHEVIKPDPAVSFGDRFKIKDEIDDLVLRFNDMKHRLWLAHKELKEAQSSLVHAEKMGAIGTLVAGICHSINNPIAGLRNCIVRISKAPGNVAQNQQYLPIMSEAVENAETILNELLLFSRKEEVKFEPFDLHEIVDTVISLLGFAMEVGRISFTKKFSPNIPLIFGSANQMEQVVLNIVKNGIDAIKERKLSEPGLMGEITFTLSATGENVILEISDNGTGVEESKLKKMFDPFYTTKKKGEGTGLGLSISYNIIQYHRGKINAFINESHGLTFSISLPVNNKKLSNQAPTNEQVA